MITATQPRFDLSDSIDAPLVIPQSVIDCLSPMDRVDSCEWIVDNVCMPDEVPFSTDRFPWTPGICAAGDRDDVEIVALQFAARLGKTAIAQSQHVCHCANRPTPSLFGSAIEGLAKQIVKLKLLKMLRETDATAKIIPSNHELLQSRLDLLNQTVYVAWSGSPTKLADIDPDFLHANEIDKWTYQTSLEADSLDLFLERGAERPTRKVWLESTPAVQGHSRINKFLVNGWDCRFNVPCKKCGRFQQLEINKGKNPKDGGLWWDRTEEGRHPSPSVAYETARYVCKYCHAELGDEHRRPMIRKGVWVPRGQRAVPGKAKSGSPRIVGQMSNPGPVASFKLGRIYAPTFTFGDIARGYVGSRDDLSKEQNFANSWEGDVWNPRAKMKTWSQIAEHLCLDYEIGTCPADVVFLTAGIDVQLNHLVAMVVGWGPGQKGYLINYGIADTYDSLFGEFINRPYSHPIGRKLFCEYTLIDAKFNGDEVRTEALKRNKKGYYVWPYEGQKGSMAGKSYALKPLSDNAKKSKSKIWQSVKGATNFWQTWIDNVLYYRGPGMDNSVVMPTDSRHDQDLFEQLTNEGRNFEKNVWEPINHHEPWDFRDTLRYCRIAAEIRTRGAWNRLLPLRRSRKSSETTKRRNWIRGAQR